MHVPQQILGHLKAIMYGLRRNRRQYFQIFASLITMSEKGGGCKVRQIYPNASGDHMGFLDA
jgi:hypothetical protein